MKTKMLIYRDSFEDWYNEEFRESVRNLNLYRAVALRLNTCDEANLEIRDL
ncbi:hypothetical protein [Methanofollis fontis]|uniref:hypothetical protein n=1 Tax=Methanofollis fontis TaxID=2052832 RepID=UPI0013EED210|nr:hypothetical protein [Methanofollis fontis]